MRTRGFFGCRALKSGCTEIVSHRSTHDLANQACDDQANTHASMHAAANPNASHMRFRAGEAAREAVL